MKIKALVTLVTKHVSGKTVTVNPGKTSNVDDKLAKKHVKDGYAEKANPNDQETAGEGYYGGAPIQTETKKPPKAKQSTKGGKADKKRTIKDLTGADADTDGDDGAFEEAESTDDEESNS